jgi:hypothetical protein
MVSHIVCMLCEAKILSVIRPDHSSVNKLITWPSPYTDALVRVERKYIQI